MIPGDERTRYTVSSKASPKIRSKSTSEFWVVKKDASAVISTKMLAHASHFRVIYSVFSHDLMLQVVAVATRQYFMYPKSEHTECVTRGFSWYVRTRFFLLSLLPFLSSFFGKKEERNEELYKKLILIEKLKNLLKITFLRYDRKNNLHTYILLLAE